MFPNFEVPDIYLNCLLSEKQAQKLMTDCNNMFEEFVKRFYIRYGKLQIEGFHNLNYNPLRNVKSVSPQRRQQFNVHPGLVRINQGPNPFQSNEDQI